MVESNKIKRLREKLGLSQEKLARLADVSNNTKSTLKWASSKTQQLIQLRKLQRR